MTLAARPLGLAAGSGSHAHGVACSRLGWRFRAVGTRRERLSQRLPARAAAASPHSQLSTVGVSACRGGVICRGVPRHSVGWRAL